MTVIAACQLALATGDLAGNARAAESAVHNAAARGAQLVVLPELSDTGYVFTGPAEARALAAPAAPEHRPLRPGSDGTGRTRTLMEPHFCYRA